MISEYKYNQQNVILKIPQCLNTEPNRAGHSSTINFRRFQNFSMTTSLKATIRQLEQLAMTDSFGWSRLYSLVESVSDISSEVREGEMGGKGRLL